MLAELTWINSSNLVMVNQIGLNFVSNDLWGCHVTDVTCLLSGKESVMNIMHDCKIVRERLRSLEEECDQAQAQQTDEWGQIMQMLEKFGEEKRL